MTYKKFIAPVLTALVLAVLVTSNLVSAASLGQAVGTLPQNDEWSIMAYASLGQNVGASYLRQPLNSNVATDYEKRILAITAQRQNPSNYSSENFVVKLQSMFDGTQIGSASLLNDDIFGILALYSAGINDNTVSKSRGFLLSNQNSDGGWGYAPGLGSDSNTTAMAVAALAATGSVPNSATDYLYRSQASGSGFAFTPGQAADGASTAWVISGLISARKSVPAEAKSYLENLQTSNGSFKWHASDSTGSSLVTAYAVIALSGHSLPINTISSSPAPTPTPTPTPAPSPAPTPQPTPVDNRPQGVIDPPSCSLINGWAFDPDATSQSIPVEVYANGPQGLGVQIFSSPTLELRPDVNNHFQITGYHGWSVATPQFLKDGQSHQIWLYAQGILTANRFDFNTASCLPPVPAPIPSPPPAPTPPTPPAPPAPTSPHPVTIQVTINFPGNKIFNGPVSDTGNVTALSAMISSADQINLLYQVTSTSLGQFVKSINGYGPDGAAGWQYAVNGQIPQEAAANFVLHSGDKLQWFYGNPGISPY